VEVLSYLWECFAVCGDGCCGNPFTVFRDTFCLCKHFLSVEMLFLSVGVLLLCVGIVLCLWERFYCQWEHLLLVCGNTFCPQESFLSMVTLFVCGNDFTACGDTFCTWERLLSVGMLFVCRNTLSFVCGNALCL
jgi:hypothetical protein